MPTQQQASLLAAWSRHCGISANSGSAPPVPADYAAGFAAAWDMQQATIDRLMLEHCPAEMTPEQFQQWIDRQRPSSAQN